MRIIVPPTRAPMLPKRIATVLVILPVGLLFIHLGGMAFSLLVAIVLSICAFEYVRLFQMSKFSPSMALCIVGTFALALHRAILGFNGVDALFSLLILAAITFYMIMYERGQDTAATDFGITLGGIFYIGWIGSYLISLRNLPAGEWWFLLALPIVWLTDTGAYLIGSRFGRHQILPRLSPKKSWEGYLGGIAFGVLGGLGLSALWAQMTPAVTLERGLLLSLAVSVLTILGDTAESMIKRQAGAKDSGSILPGHGGMFDRIDSWIWAGVIAYYIAIWFG